MSLLGRLYRHEERRELRNILFAAEIIVCMILMHSLNLVYDGVVLLIAADLMYRYEGHHRELFCSRRCSGCISWRITIRRSFN